VWNSSFTGAERTAGSTTALVRGTLWIEEETIKEYHRLCRVATIRGPKGERLRLPLPLRDAVLLCAKLDLWSMSGHEIGDVNGIPIAYAQTWFLIPAARYGEDRRLDAEAMRAYEENKHLMDPPPRGRARTWKP
jgi:hypothetical protein